MRKILILDEQTEKALHAVCHAALKAEGLQAHALVNQLGASIREEKEQDSE